jgi:glycosyltransferase involved in cell wall biosynthesis
MLPFVSVLTPTANRRLFIPAAIRCFKNQTYPQDRMEWIILDDGEDKVKDLFDAAGLKNVRYYPLEGPKKPIGEKRNMLNGLAKGDICVAWDDDDFYPPERIRKSITRLRAAPRAQVAGSSQIYLYFSDRDEIWSIGPYNPNHCTNGTMTYWRSYTKDHRYDDTAEKAEERKFMNDWKTTVAQVPPEEMMLVICHPYNTFDKRNLLKQNNPLLKKTTLKMRQLVKDKELRDFYLSLARDYAMMDARKAAVEAEIAAEMEYVIAEPVPTLVVSDLSAEEMPTESHSSS